VARETFGEPTERATPKRREEARREGKVARSAELTGALVLLAGVTALSSLGGRMLQKLAELTRAEFLSLGSTAQTPAAVCALFQRVSIQVLFVLLPFLAVLTAVGLTSNFLQVGFFVSGKPLLPRWSVLNPAEGFKRIFSLRSLTELVKAIAKITIIGSVAWVTVKGDLQHLVPLEGAGAGILLQRIGAATVRLGLRVGFALLALAILDYGYQRWEYERSIRMSKQEVEEEQKQTEGDPHVKARIRLLQRTMARKRMMADVQTADLVVTNPTHLAVALKYDRSKMSAPVVVAKGMRKMAEKIKEVAREHHVPMVEDPPLARLLYKESKLGQPIPVSLYRAVAQVLAHVWRLRQRAAGAGL
jgi:flagellar biosynthesis protein FlhB